MKISGKKQFLILNKFQMQLEFRSIPNSRYNFKTSLYYVTIIFNHFIYYIFDRILFPINGLLSESNKKIIIALVFRKKIEIM